MLATWFISMMLYVGGITFIAFCLWMIMSILDSMVDMYRRRFW